MSKGKREKPAYQAAFEEEYPFVGDADQKLRAFIFDGIACGGAAEIDGRILVLNMQMCFEWVKSGAMPPSPQIRHRTIKAVKE